MTEPSAEPLCAEEFIETTTRKKIVVRLWAPTFDSDKDVYICATEVVGVDGEGLRLVYGECSFQAISLAFRRFGLIFEKEGDDFRTPEGDSPHTYFPREIPWVYGSDVYQRLCNMVADEIQVIEDERTRRRERRAREGEA